MKDYLDEINELGGVSIVTHNDPDGILAAAIAVRSLHQLGVVDLDVFFESPSAIQKKESRFLDENSEDFVGGFIIVLDLPFNNSASIWIDHHEQSVVPEPGEYTREIIHDKSNSASILAHNFFSKYMPEDFKLCDLKFLNFINCRDIGLNPGEFSPEYETFSLAIYENRNDYNFFTDLVFMVAKTINVRQIIADHRIVLKSKRQLKKIKKGKKEFDNLVVSKSRDEFISQIDDESDKSTGDHTKSRIFIFNNFLFIDFSDFSRSEQDISIPYYIINEQLSKYGLDYSFLLVIRGDELTGEFHCTVSINQNKKKIVERYDVSLLANNFGGGGHHFVAGFIIKPDQFLATIKKAILFFLNI